MGPLRVLALFAVSSTVFAADPARLMVRMNDASPIEIGATDLAGLPRKTVSFNNHGTVASYEGVLVSDILRKAGLDLGKGLHGKQFAAYVAAIGSDDYDVVFSLAEFDSAVMDSDIIIADKENGAPLAEKEGPLRVVAPHDKKPARSVRMLKEIDVVQLRK